MDISEPGQPAPFVSFENLNWISSDPLPRDQDQSHRLHEPDHLINSIDPITGRDIGNVSGHPFIIDGNLTIYFESEMSRKTYRETPLNYPYARLPGSMSEEIDRGG